VSRIFTTSFASVYPGHRLGFPHFTVGFVHQPYTADNVELPQLHRSWPLPSLVGVLGSFPFPRPDQPEPDQDPVDRRDGRHRLAG
jgi:hypothetical protein